MASWPNKNRPRAAMLTDYHELLGRNTHLWIEIFKSQLPRAIREEFVFTLQLNANLASLGLNIQVLARRKGVAIKYNCTIPMPENRHDISELRLPDEFVARLCVAA